MSGQAVERDIIARPPVRHAAVSLKQLGLAGAALLAGIGAALFAYHWWTALKPDIGFKPEWSI